VKALKYLGAGAGAAALLAALALGAALAIVDGAFVKRQLERAMADKQRTLRIEGEPKLTLFPVAGIALGKLTLSEPASDKTFVALESAEVAVRVMPLFSGEIAVETLKIAGLTANIVRARDGRMNFADLAGPREERPAEPAAAPRLSLAQVDIARARVDYRDEASGQALSVADLALRIGRLDGEAPGPVAFSARVTGKRPEIDLGARAGGALSFDLSRQRFALEGFSAVLKGRLERDTVSAELAAPKLEITPSRAGGSALTAALRLKGPARNVDAKLRLAALEGTARALLLPGISLELDAATAGFALKAKADGALKADLARASADADLTVRLDDSTIKAKLGATRLAPLHANFELDIDRLNLDRYAAPKKAQTSRSEGAAAPEAPLDLSVLKGPELAGRVAIGALAARGLKLADVRAQIRLAGGKLEVSPHSARLYGGSASGSLRADADGNRIALKETVQGVDIAPLLEDLGQGRRLEGRAALNLDLATAGQNVAVLKKALNGSARVEIRDGAVKGFNLAESLRDVKSVLGSTSAKAAHPAKKTDFSEITASFAIRNGVARNDDLQGKAPAFRLSGAGDLDLGNNAIRYVAKASIVATSQGQGGKDLSHLAGVTVPVRLTGALDKPDWTIDYGELAARAGVGKVVEAVGAAAGGAAGSVRERLRGLLGR
jgi:AsmA protein